MINQSGPGPGGLEGVGVGGVGGGEGGELQTSSAVSFTQTVAKTGRNLRVCRHVSYRRRTVALLLLFIGVLEQSAWA